MDSVLVDFLNHGYLPFTGRGGDLERISAFLTAMPDADRMRALLITGEAGVGKSRLIEEIVPAIIREGSMVVRAKLFPETTVSIVPSLVRALRHINLQRNLLSSDLDETLPSVASALRRLGRLRPTIIIIEDIHLLGGEALGELSRLLDAIGDEPISMICTARPLGSTVRGILTPFLVDDIDLQGLNEKDVGMLLEELFATRSEEIIREIRHLTLGNPLALRSALRGLMKSGAFAHDPATGTWQPTVSPEIFRRTLQRSIELLSEGMAAHLTPSEKDAAERIASLGEVFSSRTAEALLGDDRWLSPLIFKGILVASETPGVPIQGDGSGSTTLVFTHTLLHRRFADQDNVDVNMLLNVIGANLPLYSLVPFQALDRHAAEITADPPTIASAILQIAEVAHEIDTTVNWHEAPRLWEYAWKLLELHGSRWNTEEEQGLRLDLMKHRIALLRRQEPSDEYGRRVEEYLALTVNPQSPKLVTHRILGLVFRMIHTFRSKRYIDTEARSEIDELTARAPDLLFSQTYVFYLEQLARFAKTNVDKPLLRSIEQHFKLILSSEDLTDEFRLIATRKLLPYLLVNFETREQLELRLAWLDQMEQRLHGDDQLDMLGMSAGFLVHVGEFDRALQVMDRTTKRTQEWGMPGGGRFPRLNKLFIFGAFGMKLQDLEPDIRKLYAESATLDHESLRESIPLYMIELGYLSGELDRAYRLFEELWVLNEPPVPIIGAILALYRRDRAELRSLSFPAPEDAKLDRVVTEAGQGKPIDEEALTALLQTTILSVDDLMPMRIALRLATHTVEGDPLEVSESMRREISAALTHTMEWIERHGLPPFMTALLNEYKAFFTKQEITRWQDSIARIGETRNRLLNGQTDPDNGRIRLTMLGSIAVDLPDGRRIPIRGSRLRALLGLMVADRMVDTRLDHQEFCSIITGIDDDPDRARRSLNGVVYRLRETVGHDIVVTDGETPVLNHALMSVDLLEVDEQLSKAATALQQNALLRAYRAMMRALEILRGDVPFPTLYERFFEALRDDFENRLRNLILRTAQGLLAANDPDSAETLLTIGFRSMPEDEEIAENLYRTFIRLGKRTEAERVRIRTAIGDR